jgi:Holliday junction resolvase
MPVTSGFGKQGAPDFLVCLSGRFVGIECKAGSNKPTALQEKNLEQIDKAGGEAYVVNEDSIEQLQEVLDSIVFSYKAL